jgi:amino acid transporter
VKRRRLKAGEAIWLLSAVGLFVFMFFSWFGSELSGQAEQVAFFGEGGGGNAWQTLEGISFALMLTVAVAVGAALMRIFGSNWEPAIPPSAAVAVLGGISTLLIVLRILFPPDLGDLGGVSINATRHLGVFLGFAAAAGIAYGGYRAMGERGTSFAKVADSLSGRRDKQG